MPIYSGLCVGYVQFPRPSIITLILRQGGGSTFGVITSATIKAFPSTPFITATAFLGTTPGNEAYWDVVTYILSQFPSLDEQGISCYSFIVTSFASAEFNIPSPVDGYVGTFLLPALHPSNSSDSLKSTITKLFAEATAPYPFQFFTSVKTRTYPDFWAWYSVSNGPLDAGHDRVIGSRLLGGKALTQNLTALKETYKAITPAGSITMVYLVGGKNVMNAVPRGGSNAVNPAWRKAYVHSREFQTLVGMIHPLTKSQWWAWGGRPSMQLEKRSRRICSRTLMLRL
jgi:hypothetical protein